MSLNGHYEAVEASHLIPNCFRQYLGLLITDPTGMKAVPFGQKEIWTSRNLAKSGRDINTMFHFIHFISM